MKLIYFYLKSDVFEIKRKKLTHRVSRKTLQSVYGCSTMSGSPKREQSVMTEMLQLKSQPGSKQTANTPSETAGT